MKRSEKNISYEKAVHMSALVADLWNVTRKSLRGEQKDPKEQKEQKAPEVLWNLIH